jgi:peptidoglycan/LPS O-acetylase OafA/YrhL
MKTARLHQVDVWRFIAIGLVLSSHLIAYSHPWYATVADGLVWRLEILGLVGVKIFFCISGYVICRGMVREWESSGRLDMRAFYRRRVFRIVPPLFVYIGVVALLNAVGVFDLPAGPFLQSAAFLCNIGSLGDCTWPLAHTWSLAYEEQFYLVFPLLFSLLLLAIHRRRIGMLCLALACGCVITHFTDNRMINTCLSYVLCMLAGCACALYWDRLHPLLRKLPVTVWGASMLLMFGSASMGVPTIVSEVGFPLVLPILICIAVFGTPTHRPLVEALFCNRRLAYLGQISYGVYLWQQLATFDYGFSSPLAAWGLVLAAIVFAHYSFVYFELPLIRRGAAHPNAAPKLSPIVQGTMTMPLADDGAQTPPA